MHIFIYLFLPCMLFLSGCTVGPTYVPPCVDTPSDWKAPQGAQSECVYKDYWWEVFEDETLNTLEKEALTNNYNLQIAFSQVQKSQALMQGAEAKLFPKLTLDPAYNNEGTLYESYSTRTVVRAHEQLFALPLNLNYEVDLWGKIRSRYDAAKYHWEGENEAYYAVMLSLTADLATVYFQIRTLDKQIDILQSTLVSREKALKINRSRYNAEVNNYSDVTRAGAEASMTAARYQEALRHRAVLENKLAVLIGESPSEFQLPHNPLQGLPPPIPAGIPSDVLKRRPDIAEAEREVASTNASVRVAYASFFPSLSLTGALGYSSPHFRYFLKNFSRLWSYGATSDQVIFDGGALYADLAYQRARFDEADSAYQQQVLMAFEQVEDALSNISRYEKAFSDMNEGVEWSSKTYRIANSRYSKGMTFYLDVVNSEQIYLNDQLALNDLQGLRFAATVQLIKALGGGWDCEN